MESYMTFKGRIVIPVRIRRKFGMKEGTRVRVEMDESAHRIILTPITRDYIQNLCGKYKGNGLLAALAKDRKAELVTGDREFKQVEGEVNVRWL
jgi:AbrB family looped-hinge helix DNA binding protein